MNRVPVLAAALWLLAAPAALAQAEYRPNPEGRGGRILRTLLAEQVENALLGRPALSAIPGQAPPELASSATELAGRFAENEVAANRALRDKRVLLSGPIQVVRLDQATGRAVLPFAVAPRLLPVQARMTGSEEDFAASLRPGQSVRLLCTGQGLQAAVIVLEGCRDAERRFTEATEAAWQDVARWLRTGAEMTAIGPSERTSAARWRSALFLMIWRGDSLPERASCLLRAPDGRGCGAQMFGPVRPRDAARLRAEYEAAHHANAARLALEMEPIPYFPALARERPRE